MAITNLLSAAKISKSLGVSPTLVKNFINNNRIKPLETKGNCNYYGDKTIRLVEREFFLSTGNIAKNLGIPQARVKSFILDNKIKADRIKGNCNYFGPKTIQTINRGLK